MRKLLLLLLLLSPAWAETPRQLIDSICKNPGSFDQSCRPVTKNYKTLPLYGYRRFWADAHISKENFQKLRDQRLAVVREVAVEIDQINVARSLKDFSRGEVLMMVILDLNGVETLSALLRLEKEFDKVAYYKNPKVKPAAEEFMLPAHVQVLSTITAILQNEKAAGLDQLGQSAVYDQDHRDTIVALAQKFVDNTDPQNYRRAAGMTPSPSVR
jgi:hypothetical protein